MISKMDMLNTECHARLFTATQSLVPLVGYEHARRQLRILFAFVLLDRHVVQIGLRVSAEDGLLRD